MSDDHQLTPEIEQIVRKQLSTGRFHDENEVFSAALHLLDGQSPLPVASLDAVFGIWRGRDTDGLTMEQHLRSDWSK